MMGLLQDYGYTLTETMQDADALVVNSCTVKGPSQDTMFTCKPWASSVEPCYMPKNCCDTLNYPCQDNAVNLVKSAQDAGKAVVLAGCVPTADASLAKSLAGVSRQHGSSCAELPESLKDFELDNRVMQQAECPRISGQHDWSDAAGSRG